LRILTAPQQYPVSDTRQRPADSGCPTTRFAVAQLGNQSDPDIHGRSQEMATRTDDDATQSMAADLQEKGSEVVASAREQVGTKAVEVREDAAFRLREEIDKQSTEAGRQVEAVGQAMRSGAEQLRSDGKAPVAGFVEGVAQRLEDLGSYLEHTDAEHVLADVEAFARRRPWLTAGAAALGGFIASRFVKASSERRYDSRADTYPDRTAMRELAR
jgi:hypothetical protein